MFKKLLSGVLLSASILLLSGCQEGSDGNWQDRNAGRVFKIGVITSLTGPTAALGQQQKNILDFHLEKLNNKNSFKVELIYADGQCDAGVAEDVLKTLVEEKKIEFVIGGLCSPATFGAALIAKEERVLLMSAITSNKKLAEMGPKVMSLSYTDDLLPETIAQELLKYGKVATISEKADESTTLEKDLDDLLFSKYKDSIVLAADEKFERESTDLTEHLNIIRRSGAKAVWLNPSSRTSALELLRAMEKAGLEAKPIGQFAYKDPDLLEQAPPIVNNMVIIDYPTVQNPEFLNYRKEIIAAKGPLDNIDEYYTAATIDALDILVKLISENGGDFESVHKALTTGTFIGNIGKIYFGGNTFIQNQKAQKYEVEEHRLVVAQTGEV